jgi:hypothetical protein
VLVVVLFSVCSEKALGVMDQTLRGRSHHELVNSFAKKNFIRKPISIPIIKKGLKQKHHCPI